MSQHCSSVLTGCLPQSAAYPIVQTQSIQTAATDSFIEIIVASAVSVPAAFYRRCFTYVTASVVHTDWDVYEDSGNERPLVTFFKSEQQENQMNSKYSCFKLLPHGYLAVFRLISQKHIQTPVMVTGGLFLVYNIKVNKKTVQLCKSAMSGFVHLLLLNTVMHKVALCRDFTCILSYNTPQSHGKLKTL